MVQEQTQTGEFMKSAKYLGTITELKIDSVKPGLKNYKKYFNVKRKIDLIILSCSPGICFVFFVSYS